MSFLKYIIYLFGCTGLCCGEQGLLFTFSVQASHCSGPSCYRAQALGSWASVVAACKLIVVA